MPAKLSKPTSLRGLGALQELLRGGAHGRAVGLADGRKLKPTAARGDREIEVGARPILILEDPESRLHPTMLALAWATLEQLPWAKNPDHQF